MPEFRIRPDAPPAVLKLLEVPSLVDIPDLHEIAVAYFKRYGFSVEVPVKSLDPRDRYLVKQVQRNTILRCQPGERSIAGPEVEQFSRDLKEYQAGQGVLFCAGEFSEIAGRVARSSRITPVSRDEILKQFLQLGPVPAPVQLNEIAGTRKPNGSCGSHKRPPITDPSNPSSCKEALWLIFREDPGLLSVDQVIEIVRARFPNSDWEIGTISAHLYGLVVGSKGAQRNHPSINSYAFLDQALRKRQYRLHKCEDR